MKWKSYVDESRPKVVRTGISLVFDYETNLLGEDGQCLRLGPLGLTLEDEEIGKLFEAMPYLKAEAESDSDMAYEEELANLRQEHAAYLEKWRDITERRKATMAARGKTYFVKKGVK